MNKEINLVKKKKLFLPKVLKKIGIKTLDFIYPPLCIHCLKPIEKENNLCAKCWRELRPICDPLCNILGLPFNVSLGKDAISAEAIASPPEFRQARSAFIYNDISHSIVSKLKYGDKQELAKFCASTINATCFEFLANKPILIPVPLHISRQRQRHYNQSYELAKQLGLIIDAKVEPMFVERIKNTRQQVGLNAIQREKNVANAFKIKANAPLIDKEQRIMIIDDVITTGATVNALAKTLKKAGYKKIDVISFARSIKLEDL